MVYFIDLSLPFSVANLLKTSTPYHREQLETVRKDRVFEEDITQEEMDIIQQRVLLQQRQFETFQRREFLRKSRKIRKVFPHLTDDELREALKEFNDDVNNVILNFTGTEYLSKIRKLIAAKFDSANKNGMGCLPFCFFFA